MNEKFYNLKEEFINWLINNKKNNYFNNDKVKINEALNEYNTYFDVDIFNAEKGITDLIKFINTELYNNPNPLFNAYSEKQGTHKPRAILGKENYIAFLNEKLGSEISSLQNKFSWVKTHTQLVKYLKDFKDKQPELISLLKEIGVTNLSDKESKGVTINLQEIDPFTFFCYIHKYGSKRRLQILQNLAKTINIHFPKGESGIPTSNAQKVWLFPYKYDRINNEINRLWEFFFQVINNTVTNTFFTDILTIDGIGKTKLSEALFNINPKEYFPINKPTKPFLEQVYNINPNFDTYEEYKNILSTLRLKTNTPFYQLSYKAWLWNQEQANTTEMKENNNTEEKKTKPQKLATNQILYGPPGTGKTYATKKMAVDLIHGKTEHNENENRNDIIDQYNELVKKGQVVFTTFHQSLSYEDFVEGIKPKTSEDKKVTYEVEDGIFKQLANKASFSIAEKVKTEDITKSISFSSLYDDYVTKVSEGLEKEEELKLTTKSGGYVYIVDVSQQENLILKHKGGTTKYTVSKERLTKLNNGISSLADISNIHNTFRELIGGSNASVYWAVLNKLQKIKASTINNNFDTELNSEEKEEIVKSLTVNDYKKAIGDPYILIVDEINRGNLSAIFGELITLLDPDKRLGQEEAITVTLPYSKTNFGIPANVHIIGTMNTADRSVEALDTALRRRFEFKEMMPDYTVIENKTVNNIHLSEVLQKINTRIEVLLDKDHTIGHSYFIGIDSEEQLKAVFKNNIIPLLQEYFYNDYEKIGLVLGEGFVTKNEKNGGFKFPSFIDNNTDFAPETRYVLKNIDADFNILSALQTFLSGA